MKFEPKKGAAALEFSVVCSLLFILFLAGVEIVRINLVRHTANHAAYEAAREVIVPGANQNEAMVKALAKLQPLGIRNASISIDPPNIDDKTTSVKVSINVPMEANGWGMPRFFAGKTIRTVAELITERPPIVVAKALPVLPPPPPPPPTDPPPPPAPPPPPPAESPPPPPPPPPPADSPPPPPAPSPTPDPPPPPGPVVPPPPPPSTPRM